MTDHAAAHDPATEAAAVVGDGYDVRVLEPSPPAVAEGPFWADDPAHPSSRGADPVVAPHSGADLTWDDLIAARSDLADFAADRWLGARRQLSVLPPDYPSALFDFHRLAYSVVAEARYRCNGKFGLRYVRGGFGTPFFDDDVQVRVTGDQPGGPGGRAGPHGGHHHAARGRQSAWGSHPGATAREHDSPELGAIDRPLDVRSDVGEFLGAWFGLATAALEELRFTPGVIDPERVQLWPGHFDPAIAAGDAESGRRATYGFSPGDHAHDEPYIYVAAWGDVDRSDPFWNEEDFNGASLSYGALCAAEDHYGAALDFLRDGYARLSR